MANYQIGLAYAPEFIKESDLPHENMWGILKITTHNDTGYVDMNVRFYDYDDNQSDKVYHKEVLEFLDQHPYNWLIGVEDDRIVYASELHEHTGEFTVVMIVANDKNCIEIAHDIRKQIKDAEERKQVLFQWSYQIKGEKR